MNKDAHISDRNWEAWFSAEANDESRESKKEEKEKL